MTQVQVNTISFNTEDRNSELLSSQSTSSSSQLDSKDNVSNSEMYPNMLYDLIEEYRV